MNKYNYNILLQMSFHILKKGNKQVKVVGLFLLVMTDLVGRHTPK